MTTRQTPEGERKIRSRTSRRKARPAPDPELDKWFEEALIEEQAGKAIDQLFDGAEDERPTRAQLEAAEPILTGAPISIELGEPTDDNEDERDRITRQVVGKILQRVCIEQAVVTEDGKLALLIELF
jgi:hypothetical protein